MRLLSLRMHCIQMQLAKKRSWNSKDSLKDQKSRSKSFANLAGTKGKEFLTQRRF
ncbi:unnamed protein product [Cladocopium goreaui]|uniref:Uncharacterized protein n=1 Tax=Cladocopium goreaui TaxID=2562237 RepID=A0A9P1DF80_9DINO|nr:unnamed protein product [Cladocopium goreaui]